MHSPIHKTMLKEKQTRCHVCGTLRGNVATCRDCKRGICATCAQTSSVDCDGGIGTQRRAAVTGSEGQPAMIGTPFWGGSGSDGKKEDDGTLEGPKWPSNAPWNRQDPGEEEEKVKRRSSSRSSPQQQRQQQWYTPRRGRGFTGDKRRSQFPRRDRMVVARRHPSTEIGPERKIRRNLNADTFKKMNRHEKEIALGIILERVYQALLKPDMSHIINVVAEWSELLASDLDVLFSIPDYITTVLAIDPYTFTDEMIGERYEELHEPFMAAESIQNLTPRAIREIWETFNERGSEFNPDIKPKPRHMYIYLMTALGSADVLPDPNWVSHAQEAERHARVGGGSGKGAPHSAEIHRTTRDAIIKLNAHKITKRLIADAVIEELKQVELFGNTGLPMGNEAAVNTVAEVVDVYSTFNAIEALGLDDVMRRVGSIRGIILSVLSVKRLGHRQSSRSEAYWADFIKKFEAMTEE